MREERPTLDRPKATSEKSKEWHMEPDSGGVYKEFMPEYP